MAATRTSRSSRLRRVPSRSLGRAGPLLKDGMGLLMKGGVSHKIATMSKKGFHILEILNAWF